MQYLTYPGMFPNFEIPVPLAVGRVGRIDQKAYDAQWKHGEGTADRWMLPRAFTMLDVKRSAVVHSNSLNNICKVVSSVIVSGLLDFTWISNWMFLFIALPVDYTVWMTGRRDGSTGLDLCWWISHSIKAFPVYPFYLRYFTRSLMSTNGSF